MEERNTSLGKARSLDKNSELESSKFVKRPILAALGIFFVALAAVGVFLPGIPTVGPLLLASVLLTKSSPALEARLVRNKFFARYLKYVDGTEELSFKAKLSSILLMWCSIALSCLLLGAAKLSYWFIFAVIAAGIIGTIFILRFGKKSQ